MVGSCGFENNSAAKSLNSQEADKSAAQATTKQALLTHDGGNVMQ